MDLEVLRKKISTHKGEGGRVSTHSERDAETAAILFTHVESCKLNNVNPRQYLEKLAQDLLQGQSPYTPKVYADLAKN